MKKAQTWSTDAIVAVVMFLFGAILLFYFAGPASETGKSDAVQTEASQLPATLGAGQNLSAAFIEGGKVSEEKLKEAVNLSYDSLKDLLGVKSDFCIYFEDEQGNIVPINGRAGVGSGEVNFSGTSCNATIA